MINKFASFRVLILFFILIIFLSHNQTFATEKKDYYYTPLADIVNIIKNSGRFDYHATYLSRSNALKNYKKSLKFSSINQLIIKENNTKKIFNYSPKNSVSQLILRAKKFHKNNNFNETEKLLKLSQKQDPNYSMTFVYLGKLYLAISKYKKAHTSLDKALKINPANFTAYKAKATLYVTEGEYNKAKKNLILALIYNRNDKEAWGMLQDLSSKLGFKIFKEPFLPLYSLQKMDNGKIRIYLDTDQLARWMPYGFCKGVWRYEPGYFYKKTGKKKYVSTIYEEMESINNMIWAYNTFLSRDKIKIDPYLERLKKIKSRFFIKEFVIFEVISPTNPEVLATLDKKHILDMIDYINEFILVKDPRLIKKTELTYPNTK